MDFELIIEKYNKKLDACWKQAAEHGWYMTPESPIRSTFNIDWDGNVDEQMATKVEKKYSKIKTGIVIENGDRQRIVNSGIRLHEQGEFAGSVLIFISQADGLFEELVTKNGSGFWGRNNGTPKRNKFIPTHSGYYTELIFSLGRQKNNLDEHTSKTTDHLNRNGALHGMQAHLDYDTKINSLKSLCILSYVAWISREIENSQPAV